MDKDIFEKESFFSYQSLLKNKIIISKSGSQNASWRPMYFFVFHSIMLIKAFLLKSTFDDVMRGFLSRIVFDLTTISYSVGNNCDDRSFDVSLYKAVAEHSHTRSCGPKSKFLDNRRLFYVNKVSTALQKRLK